MTIEEKRLLTADVIILLLALFVGLLLTGCRSVRVVEREVVRTDTLVSTQIERDSIYINDSIFVRELIQGDTVRITTDRWHTRWRDRIKYDSIYIAQRDTVRVTDVREVPRKINGWQWFQIWCGRLALIAIGLTAAVIIIRRKYAKLT